MAKLRSTEVFGDLDITGKLRVDGSLVYHSDYDPHKNRIESIEAANAEMALIITQLQNIINNHIETDL
ncbi:hypothetical protein [Paraclostridium dentum]|uniref:hypothetical protein n=1 Tax=Paraclostridium dentum TaxID=2662455 RepID=UPI003F32E265